MKKMRCVTAPECLILSCGDPNRCITIGETYYVDVIKHSYCRNCRGAGHKCATAEWCDKIRDTTIVSVNNKPGPGTIVEMPLSFFTDLHVNNVTVLRKAMEMEK